MPAATMKKKGENEDENENKPSAKRWHLQIALIVSVTGHFGKQKPLAQADKGQGTRIGKTAGSIPQPRE